MANLSAPAKTGHGATVTFDDGGGAQSIVAVRISGLDETLEALDYTNLSTTGSMRKLPADLTDLGEITVDWRWDMLPLSASIDWFPIGTDGELVITMPQWNTASTGGGTITGQAFITGSRSPDLESNVVNEGTLTFTWSNSDDGALSLVPESD